MIGRYWGWDPKETWALISFFSIIMTSFGVNYYLSGLHSYATGEAVPIPTWVFVLVGFVGITIGIGAAQNRKTRP